MGIVDEDYLTGDDSWSIPSIVFNFHESSLK